MRIWFCYVLHLVCCLASRPSLVALSEKRRSRRCEDLGQAAELLDTVNGSFQQGQLAGALHASDAEILTANQIWLHDFCRAVMDLGDRKLVALPAKDLACWMLAVYRWWTSLWMRCSKVPCCRLPKAMMWWTTWRCRSQMSWCKKNGICSEKFCSDPLMFTLLRLQFFGQPLQKLWVPWLPWVLWVPWSKVVARDPGGYLITDRAEKHLRALCWRPDGWSKLWRS